MVHRQARLLNRVDMRHDDAECAAVERARGHVPLPVGTRTIGAIPLSAAAIDPPELKSGTLVYPYADALK